MNHTCPPKEVLLPDWTRRDKQGKKGDRVKWDKLFVGKWQSKMLLGDHDVNSNWDIV